MKFLPKKDTDPFRQVVDHLSTFGLGVKEPEILVLLREAVSNVLNGEIKRCRNYRINLFRKKYTGRGTQELSCCSFPPRITKDPKPFFEFFTQKQALLKQHQL